MKIPPWALGLLLLLACSFFTLAGYIVGEKRGIAKGGEAGGVIARIYLEADKDFKLLLYAALQDRARPEADEGIRELMVTGLEAYVPARALLAAEPFSQEYERFSQDQELINDAVDGLKDVSLTLSAEEES